MNQNEKIDRINFLQETLGELSYFITTLDTYPEADKNKKATLKKNQEIKTTYSILGYRWFGCGSHSSEVEIPITMVNEIVVLAKVQQQKYQKELNHLLNISTS